ncbi:MAG: PD-(D/E)XK nuclease domain-containing protein, partial [Eubacteriales bacterium]
FHREQCMDLVREWYNGYVFGKKQVYNPWSLVRYMNDLRVDAKSYPTAHWANTSSNSIVKDLIYGADEVVKAEIEVLLSGGSIEKPIHEDITYEDVYKSKDNLWNFLYFTGYLKKVKERYENRKKYATLTIPNEEVAYIYDEHIMDWMNECVYSADLTKLYEATIAGDVDIMEEEITRVLERTISCYDGTVPTQRETFYHGVMIGLYQGMKGYLPISNRESGNGRPDFIVKYITHRGKACLMEFKVAEKVVEIESKVQEALNQVEDRKYRVGLEDEGYADILEYGIAFYKKTCVVRRR